MSLARYLGGTPKIRLWSGEGNPKTLPQLWWKEGNPKMTPNREELQLLIWVVGPPSSPIWGGHPQASITDPGERHPPNLTPKQGVDAREPQPQTGGDHTLLHPLESKHRTPGCVQIEVAPPHIPPTSFLSLIRILLINKHLVRSPLINKGCTYSAVKRLMRVYSLVGSAARLKYVSAMANKY